MRDDTKLTEPFQEDCQKSYSDKYKDIEPPATLRTPFSFLSLAD